MALDWVTSYMEHNDPTLQNSEDLVALLEWVFFRDSNCAAVTEAALLELWQGSQLAADYTICEVGRGNRVGRVSPYGSL